MAELADGQREEQDLRNGGFTDEEVNQWKSETVDDLRKGGFSDREVNDYFGVKEPDTSSLKGYVKENLQKEKEKRQTIDASPKPVEAQDWVDALAAGWGFSVSGLAGNQGASPIIVPENASRVMKVASQIGTLAGDLPAMVAGGAIGGLAGAPGGPTAIATAGAASFALPTALRKIMMDHYEKGDIQSASDFMDRLSSTTWETTKSAAIGAATALSGGLVRPLAGSLAATTAEIGTMVTASAAVEGHLPNADDFTNAAIVVGGLGASTKLISIAGKMRRTYAETGEQPHTLVDSMGQDVQLKQQFAAENPNLPLKLPNYEKIKTSIKAFDGFNGPTSDFIFKKIDKIKQETPKNWSEFYTQTIDDLNPIKKITEELAGERPISAANDPYKLMRTFKDYQGKVQRALEFNTIDFKSGASNGEGLQPILKKVPTIKPEEVTSAQENVLKSVSQEQLGARDSSWKGLTSYLISKRALELEKRGIETGISIKDAEEVVKTHGKQYEQVEKDLRSYQERLRKYAEDSGILSKEASKLMAEANGNYVPFYRLMAEEGSTQGPGAGIPFKKIKGSTAPILDPIESIYKNTEAVFRVAEKNRATEALVRLSEQSENPILTKVKSEQRPVKISAKEVNTFLKDHGIEGEASEGFSVWRPQKESLANNEFVVYRNGKREVYEAPKDIAEAVNSLNGNPGMTSLWMKLMKAPAQALRIGTTMTPDFIARNVIRDQFGAGVQSKYGQLPFVDMLQSIKHLWNKDEVFQDFLSSGGASGSFAKVSRLLEDNTFGVLKESGRIESAWNVVKDGFHALSVVSELAENIPRLTEFRKAGGAGGDLSQRIDAGLAAREVTVDFARAGAKTRAVSALVPFMNVGLQGTDRFIRAFNENPIKTTANAAAMITLPSVLLWWANKDDSRYKDAPNWEKDIFWLVPTDSWEKSTYADAQTRPSDLRRQAPDGSWEVNNGTIYRIPKPFEVGLLFGTLPERALSAFYEKDPSQFKGFGDTIVGGLTPNILPAFISAPAEQYTNKSFFTGNEIVSNQMEKYLPEYQYKEYTSETAKQLGKIIGYVPGLRDIGPKNAKLNSPLVIDNYIRTWTGTLGKYATELIDAALAKSGVSNPPPEPLKKISEYPVIKAFTVRFPNASLQPTEDFRKNFEETSKVTATYKMLAQKGDFESAQKVMDAGEDNFIKLDSINAAIQNQYKALQKINAHPTMSPVDKRQLMDSIYYQMTQTAKTGNELLKTYRKGLRVDN